MSDYNAEAVRNLTLVGHAGSGKTTLIEAMLAAAGVIAMPGSVEKGTTVCDTDPMERELMHSLDIGITSLVTQNKHINLIDTPGYPDFIGRSLAALEAVETAVVVVNATAGIESMTRRMMAAASSRNLCRMIVVNKIDVPDTDLAGLTEALQQLFGKECMPINLPAGQGTRVIDCFFQSAGDATDFSSVASAHSHIIDQVVEVDEALMEVYLEQGEELSPEQLHDPFEKALREGHLIPVCYVSARTGAGVPEFLNLLAKLMPNPAEGNPPLFMKGEGQQMQPVTVTPTPHQHVLAHVFKVVNDPFRGRLGIFRVYQGTLAPNSQLFVGDARKAFKVNHLYRLHGAEQIEVREAVPGDICAVARVDEIHFDAVLHDSHDEDHHHLKSIEFPMPLFGRAVRPLKHGDEQKLADALHKLSSEDPSMQVEHNAVANELVLRGLGEMHVNVLLARLRKHYHVEVEAHPPSIPYRETITVAAEGHHRHKKQTGGAGQFGEVFLRVTPLARGAGFEFVDDVVGGTIPGQFIPAVEKGVRQALAEGAVAGYPIHDVQVSVYEGKYHPVDSKEIAFTTAGRKAFLDAMAKARPTVLEPIAQIEITAPGGAVGDLAGDLSSRRGRVSGTEVQNNGQVVIRGEAPLAELEGYESRLKSITGGEGLYRLSFDRYEPVPAHIQQQLTKHFQIKDED
ncbi:MAG: elongation factor G [Pseudomonadota bacterium]